MTKHTLYVGLDTDKGRIDGAIAVTVQLIRDGGGRAHAVSPSVGELNQVHCHRIARGVDKLRGGGLYAPHQDGPPATADGDAPAKLLTGHAVKRLPILIGSACFVDGSPGTLESGAVRLRAV